MKNVTITLFIRPDSLTSIVSTFKILDDLDFENDYTIQVHDIVYTESMISNYVWMNVPVDLYLKFKVCYDKSKKLSNN